MSHIEYEVVGRTGWLRINRPEARNAMTVEMLMETQERLYEAELDPAVACILISGVGGNLTAGFDMKEVPSNGDKIAVQRHFRRASLYWHSIMHTIVRMKKPLIVGAQGTNVGGGLGLIAACDLAVIGQDTRVIPSWVSIGLGPDASSTYHLPRMVGLRRAIDWIMTNHAATAQEMLDWGYVTRVVPTENVMDECWALAESLNRVPTEILGEVKFLMHHGTISPIENQTEWEREAVLVGARTDFFHDRLVDFLGGKTPATSDVTAGQASEHSAP